MIADLETAASGLSILMKLEFLTWHAHSNSEFFLDLDAAGFNIFKREFLTRKIFFIKSIKPIFSAICHVKNSLRKKRNTYNSRANNELRHFWMLTPAQLRLPMVLVLEMREDCIPHLVDDLVRGVFLAAVAASLHLSHQLSSDADELLQVSPLDDHFAEHLRSTLTSTAHSCDWSRFLSRGKRNTSTSFKHNRSLWKMNQSPRSARHQERTAGTAGQHGNTNECSQFNHFNSSWVEQ